MHWKMRIFAMMSASIEIEVAKCLDVLRKGGLIIYPTDTVWGIGCDATNVAAINRIYKLKQRDEKKGMIVLLETEKKLVNHVKDVPAEAYILINETKKPLTIVYENAINLAPNLIAEDGTVAIRIVNDDFCNMLLSKFNRPLVSTSANISGRPAPVNYSEIEAVVLQGVDYVVNLRREENNTSSPSKIIKLGKNGQTIIIRN